MEYQIIVENSTWLVGDEMKINFWLDYRCGETLAQTFNVTDQVLQQLPPKLNNYIINHQWHIPEDPQRLFPNLGLLVT